MSGTDSCNTREEAPICQVCPHECIIGEGGMGFCGARGEREGHIVSLNYGQASALALDPIEKKPFACFMPGARILSYGSYGCNMTCGFCQNADISQVRTCGRPPTTYLSPEALVAKAKDLADVDNVGVALTYNEPLIVPEYLMDVGRQVQAQGLILAVVTNGYASAHVFDEACSVSAAMNIDLKCFTEEGYAKMGAPGGLACVTRNIRAAFDAGVHVEVTTLIVPGISDDEAAFCEEVAWLAGISPDIPLHLSRFFPQHRMVDAEPTDLSLMRRFQRIAEGSLTHVLLGNV